MKMNISNNQHQEEGRNNNNNNKKSFICQRQTEREESERNWQMKNERLIFHICDDTSSPTVLAPIFRTDNFFNYYVIW